MKKIIALVAVLAVVSSPAFAAPKKKTTVKTTTTTETTTTGASSAATPTTYSRSSSPTHDGLLLSGEFGLGTLSSKFHFGVGFRAEMPVSLEGNHFRFGGQTGFYFGPSDPTTWVIPILATGTYDFRVSSGTIVPYLGLGLGVAIAHGSGVNVPGFGTVGGGTSTNFMWQFKPGASFGSNNMYIEAPLGTIDGTFYILPSIGMHF